MSDITQSIEEARALAESQGSVVIESDEHTLLLDFDCASQKEQFGRMRDKLNECFCIESVTSWNSKSGNTHMKVRLRESLTAAERVALQAACGSDPMRELLAIRRIKLGVAEPSLLFMPTKPIIPSHTTGEI